MIEQHFTLQQAADLLACHPETLRRAAAAGKLVTIRIGRDRRIPESALRAWIDGGGSTNAGQVVSIDRRRPAKPPARKEARG